MHVVSKRNDQAPRSMSLIAPVACATALSTSRSMQNTGTKPTGSSGISSGLQPGGRAPANRTGVTQGAIGTGGGSTNDRATGNARADEPKLSSPEQNSKT